MSMMALVVAAAEEPPAAPPHVALAHGGDAVGVVAGDLVEADVAEVADRRQGPKADPSIWSLTARAVAAKHFASSTSMDATDAFAPSALP